MKEELITFKAAKLAKEKGFDEECLYYCDIDQPNRIFKRDGIPYMSDEAYLPRPTQSFLQKWLREEYGISVLVSCSVENATYFGYYCQLLAIDRKYLSNEVSRKRGFYNKLILTESSNRWTYEEALEAGLVKALNLIKTEKNETKERTQKERN